MRGGMYASGAIRESFRFLEIVGVDVERQCGHVKVL